MYNVYLYLLQYHGKRVAEILRLWFFNYHYSITVLSHILAYLYTPAHCWISKFSFIWSAYDSHTLARTRKIGEAQKHAIWKKSAFYSRMWVFSHAMHVTGEWRNSWRNAGRIFFPGLHLKKFGFFWAKNMIFFGLFLNF